MCIISKQCLVYLKQYFLKNFYTYGDGETKKLILDIESIVLLFDKVHGGGLLN